MRDSTPDILPYTTLCYSCFLTGISKHSVYCSEDDDNMYCSLWKSSRVYCGGSHFWAVLFEPAPWLWLSIHVMMNKIYGNIDIDEFDVMRPVPLQVGSYVYVSSSGRKFRLYFNI
ncbi:hypothetical protein NXS19_000853 [Fusarium pseudograminearum]|nr:hypothetical protein NXS19_000853 [Fusarium pseudograminearum]